MHNEYRLRGKTISSLMTETDFVSALWLAWTGHLPTDKERMLVNACLTACVDHGAAPPSARVARVVASCGKPLADAVAAGLLTLGPRHGNAASLASVWLREALASGMKADDLVRQALEKKQRLAGFGHPEYEVDPRTVTLAKIAKANLSATPHFDFALTVSLALTAAKGRPLPLNIDGALGAVIADLGAPAELADAIFIVSRSVGLVAQAREETASGAASYRRG